MVKCLLAWGSVTCCKIVKQMSASNTFLCLSRKCSLNKAFQKFKFQNFYWIILAFFLISSSARTVALSVLTLSMGKAPGMMLLFCYMSFVNSDLKVCLRSEFKFIENWKKTNAIENTGVVLPTDLQWLEVVSQLADREVYKEEKVSLGPPSV